MSTSLAGAFLSCLLSGCAGARQPRIRRTWPPTARPRPASASATCRGPTTAPVRRRLEGAFLAGLERGRGYRANPPQALPYYRAHGAARRSSCSPPLSRTASGAGCNFATSSGRRSTSSTARARMRLGAAGADAAWPAHRQRPGFVLRAGRSGVSLRWNDFGRVNASIPSLDSVQPRPGVLDAGPGERRIEVVAAVHEPGAGLDRSPIAARRPRSGVQIEAVRP